jgi:hypothetical protein
MTELVALAAAPKGSAVQISVAGALQPTSTNISFITINGNHPKSNANNLYVWETNSNSVPWGDDVKGTTAINTDRSVSTQPLGFIFRLGPDFIVGYSTAADPNATCATIYIPSGAFRDPSLIQLANLTISVETVASDFVQIRYKGLPRYRPNANKNWVGIWEGDAVPYDKSPPLKAADISGPESSGLVSILGMDIQLGSTYTVGYFMQALTSGRASLAAVSTFDT